MKLDNKNTQISEYGNRILYKLYDYLRDCLQKGYEPSTESMISQIEEFYIRNENVQYLYTPEGDIPISIESQKENSRKTREFYTLAVATYEKLEEDLKSFLYNQEFKEEYRDVNYSDDEKKEFLINSMTIVRRELEVVKDIFPEMYTKCLEYVEHFENNINAIDPHQNKYSQFESLRDILSKCNLNFVLTPKNGYRFYPIIVDIFLDYVHILDVLNTFEKDKERTQKRFKEFREKISMGNNDISSILMNDLGINQSDLPRIAKVIESLEFYKNYSSDKPKLEFDTSKLSEKDRNIIHDFLALYIKKYSKGIYENIDPVFVCLITFAKKERSNTIHKYILNYYLELFGDNEHINTL